MTAMKKEELFAILESIPYDAQAPDLTIRLAQQANIGSMLAWLLRLPESGPKRRTVMLSQTDTGFMVDTGSGDIRAWNGEHKSLVEALAKCCAAVGKESNP